MSLIKTIKAQLGLSNTATQNFTLTAEAADGTMKLARGNAGATTQDIITVASTGAVDFPQLVKSLGINGYLTLPGGVILQWGTTAVASLDAYTITFPTAFPTACQLALGGWTGVDSVVGVLGNVTRTTTQLTGNLNGTGAGTINWFALGY